MKNMKIVKIPKNSTKTKKYVTKKTNKIKNSTNISISQTIWKKFISEKILIFFKKNLKFLKLSLFHWLLCCKYSSLSFPILGLCDLTRALQSHSFQNPGGYPERDGHRTGGLSPEILVSNEGYIYLRHSSGLPILVS